jgi:hypothetical protein
VQPINLPILLGLSQTLRDFLRWRCCGKGLACGHQSCCQCREHMAAIDFSHFFAPMRALSARPSRRQSRITPDAGPAPNFDHDRRLQKHIAYANFYPNVSTTAYGVTRHPPRRRGDRLLATRADLSISVGQVGSPRVAGYVCGR